MGFEIVVRTRIILKSWFIDSLLKNSLPSDLVSGAPPPPPPLELVRAGTVRSVASGHAVAARTRARPS